jgi:hypothetical protein
MKKPSKLNRERELSVLIQEQNGKKKIKPPKVNTKQFWQKQKFGPASNVRRIDPKTGEVMEEINPHKQTDMEWFNMRYAPRNGTVLTLRTETEDEVIITIGYYNPDTGVWSRVPSKLDGLEDEIIIQNITGWRLTNINP